MYYILLAITWYNLFIWLRYILDIENNMRDEKYIYWDYMHSLQHIAITGITLAISIAMLFWVNSDYHIVVYFFYNVWLNFIIFPHLISEK